MDLAAIAPIGVSPPGARMKETATTNRCRCESSIWAAGQKLLPEDRRQSFDDWAAEKIRKVSHLGRWQMPEEYAAMACFLASDHAKNITGQTINIDGGQVMHS